MGQKTIVNFDYLEGPSPETLSRCLEHLAHMKAIDFKTGKITEKGRILASFPLEPKLSNVLIKSFKAHCHHEVLNIISVLSSGVWKLKAKENHFQVELQH